MALLDESPEHLPKRAALCRVWLPLFHALVLKYTLLGSGTQCPLRVVGAFGSVFKTEHPEGGETESQVLGPGLSLSFWADSVTYTVLPALPQSCRAHLQMDGLEAPALLRGLANRPACSLWNLWHWSLGSSRLTAADFRFCPVTPACEHHSQGWLPLSLHLHFLTAPLLTPVSNGTVVLPLSRLRRGQANSTLGWGLSQE